MQILQASRLATAPLINIIEVALTSAFSINSFLVLAPRSEIVFLIVKFASASGQWNATDVRFRKAAGQRARAVESQFLASAALPQGLQAAAGETRIQPSTCLCIISKPYRFAGERAKRCDGGVLETGRSHHSVGPVHQRSPILQCYLLRNSVQKNRQQVKSLEELKKNDVCLCFSFGSDYSWCTAGLAFFGQG